MASGNRLSPIPHPPTKPIVGNLLSVDKKTPTQSLARLAEELGPIFWLDLQGSPVVFVSGFELVDELFDEKRFDKTVRGALRRVRAIAGDGLFTADTTEPNWAKAHHILLPPFGSQAMHTYHAAMVDIAEQLALKWERMNSDEEIDVVHDMTALTLDTIGLCGFGYRFNSFYRRDYHPFVEALVRSLETVMMTRGLPLERIALRRRRLDMERDIAFLNNMVDDIVRDRRADITTANSKNDMLAAMLTGVDRVTREQLDDVNIRYQINTFLIAGHETTSGLLSYAIYALLKHPDVLKRAYEEVDRVFGGDLLVKPTYAQVTQLTYISQILKETLRLWPPAPIFALAPLQDETIGGKYPLKKRTPVNILVGVLHRDPAVWGPNPEAFDPDNFSREAEAKRPANAWKPFGNGQRACIGRAFAMHEAALALGMILQRFRLVDHLRYKLVLKETLTVKPDGFKIMARLRTDRPPAAHQPLVAVASSPPSSAASAVPIQRVRPGHNTPLLVLFGSNLGKAEELARKVADLAHVNGFATTFAALDDFVGKLPDTGGVLIFCASYNGAPPDNAARFLEWLEREQPAAALAGVRYAIFGCGNSDWTATYQAIPRRIDARLVALGARRVHERGEGDARADLDGDFERWFAALRPLAAKEFGIGADFASDSGGEPLYRVEMVASAPVAAYAAALGAVQVKVLANKELQNRQSGLARSTRHIEVELPGQATYRVGDHLSVVPHNDPTLVEAVARRFGLKAFDSIILRTTAGRRAQLPVDEPIAVSRLLGERVELQQVATRKQIQIMAEHTRCPATKPKLLELTGEDAASSARYRDEVLARRKSVCNLLDEHSACELPFGVFLEMMPPLAPRYYSISSSPSTSASCCSVTVAVVSGSALSGRGEFKGVCSNYLAERRVGDVVYASIRQTKAGFRLPEDMATPIIMIGPGTGLAPFRGFLQERAAQKAEGRALGPAMLFFGCRRPDHDFIYADELKAFAAAGLVDLFVAFSRAEKGKTYVQDLLAAQADAVSDLIERGAIIYVCGDGARMEPGVRRKLVDIRRARAGLDEAAGARWIEEMGRKNRYVLDVWAAS